MVFPCRREAGRLKLDVKPQNDPLHHWKINPDSAVARFQLLVCLTLSFSRVFLFLFGCGGGCASGRLKVRCCWKGSEVKLRMFGLLWWPQRPLSAIKGRAWSASVSLKWYPQPRIIISASSLAGGNKSPRAAASHPHRAMKNNFITFCKAAARPDDAVTNHQSHYLASLQCLIVFFGRHKKPLWKGSGYYWLKLSLGLTLKEHLRDDAAQCKH